MTDSRKLKIRVGLVFAGIALLVAAGGIIAGNMGISLTINMSAAGASPEGGGSASGTNYIALPYNQKFGMNTARDLFADIGSAQFLNQHRKVDDGFEVYTFGGGTLPPVGWDLKAGEAYIAKVGGSVSFAAPGSHFPDTVVEFIGGASPDSASGTNYFAPPFHSAAATARDMFIEMGGGVQFLNQHRKVDDGFEVYTFGGGTLPPNGWSFVAGEGIIVKVGGIGQRYRPLHY